MYKTNKINDYFLIFTYMCIESKNIYLLSNFWNHVVFNFIVNGSKKILPLETRIVNKNELIFFFYITIFIHFRYSDSSDLNSL